MRDVCAWIDREAPEGRDLTLIGSSLGGFYATWLAEKYGARAVLINPAIRPHEDLRPFLGRQRNLYTGEEYEVTPAHFDELAALAVPRITRPERYFLLVRTGDEIARLARGGRVLRRRVSVCRRRRRPRLDGFRRRSGGGAALRGVRRLSIAGCCAAWSAHRFLPIASHCARFLSSTGTMPSH